MTHSGAKLRAERLPFGAAAPGVGGYLLAVLITVVTFAVLLGIVASTETARSGEGFQTFVIVLLYGFYLYIPIGLTGAVLVHLVTGRSRQQWIHVVVAAAAGFVSGLFFHQVPWLPWVLALSAAIGRAGVIPFARRHLHRVASESRSVPAVLGGDEAQRQ